MTDKPIDQPRSRDGLPLTREELLRRFQEWRESDHAGYCHLIELAHEMAKALAEPAGAAPLLGLPMDLPAPPPDWKLPVRYDGTDLLDASNRILVWDGDYGERTGRYLARLVNAAGTQSSSALLGPSRQEALQLLLPAIPQGADWRANRYNTDTTMVLLFWKPKAGAPEESVQFQFDCPLPSKNVALLGPELRAGELRVDIYYGVGTHHHVSGPMGLYPSGVSAIITAVHAALDEHKRQDHLLSLRQPQIEEETKD